MKTLDELIKELGLEPTVEEIKVGRTGNFVMLLEGNEYQTADITVAKIVKQYGYEVIEVKPE